MLTSKPSKTVAVGFVIDHLNVGGAEIQLVELANALDPVRFAPRVAVLRGEGALLGRMHVPARCLGMRGPGDMRVIPRLAAWLREGRFSVIYTTLAWSIILSTLLRRLVPELRATKIIDSEHSYRVPSASPLLERWRRGAIMRADRIVAVSRAQAHWLETYLGAPHPPIEVVPNSVDPEAFTDLRGGGPVRSEFGIPPEAPVIVCVARLVPEKEHHVLLSAMETVDAHLLLVGDGCLRTDLERQVQDRKLSGRVHFAGLRDDVRPFLAAADVACMASLFESQGIALVEAMAAGLPVVATDVGGIPEVVTAGETGLLVPPGDAVALAGRLGDVLGDPTWKARAQLAGPARVRQEFSIQVRARRIGQLLETVAEA